MKCKHEPCNNEAKGQGSYCSKSCRAKQSKRNRAGATIKAQPGQLEAQPSSATFLPVESDLQVYGRKAVRYESDQYDTRPMPLNPDDQPHSGGRGRYTRQDGTVYQFDSSGTAHEITDQGSQLADISSLEHYQANPDMYIERARPELLNWGKRMNMNELNIAGKKANRVPIPGDWDYEGVIK